MDGHGDLGNRLAHVRAELFGLASEVRKSSGGAGSEDVALAMSLQSAANRLGLAEALVDGYRRPMGVLRR